MPWFARQHKAKVGESVRASPAKVDFDERLFVQKWNSLLGALSDTGGVDPFLVALGNKSALFQRLLQPQAIGNMTRDSAELLLETVMPARKRLWPQLESLGETRFADMTAALLYGDDEVDARLHAFVVGFPDDATADEKANKKRRRAVHDFAAELLHFSSPSRYPLMTRWVWDAGTLTGALREIVRGSDTVRDIDMGNDAGAYEAGRAWITERLAEQGVYREPHFVVDLFLAHAYGEYLQAMSSGMGFMQPHFGGKSDPLGVVWKLLGIDDARRAGSRVKH